MSGSISARGRPSAATGLDSGRVHAAPCDTAQSQVNLDQILAAPSGTDVSGGRSYRVERQCKYLDTPATEETCCDVE